MSQADKGKQRPSVLMSEEEHGLISQLTASIDVLAAGQKRTEDTLSKFIEATGKRFDTQAEKEQFSWGKLATFVVCGVAIAGAFGAVMSMYLGTALSPIVTQNQISIRDRQELHEQGDRNMERLEGEQAARTAAEKAAAVAAAVVEDRQAELFFAAHGHYPPALPAH